MTAPESDAPPIRWVVGQVVFRVKGLPPSPDLKNLGPRDLAPRDLAPGDDRREAAIFFDHNRCPKLSKDVNSDVWCVINVPDQVTTTTTSQQQHSAHLTILLVNHSHVLSIHSASNARQL